MADDLGGFDLWLTACLVYEYLLRQKIWAERCSRGDALVTVAREAVRGRERVGARYSVKATPITTFPYLVPHFSIFAFSPK